MAASEKTVKSRFQKQDMDVLRELERDTGLNTSAILRAAVHQLKAAVDNPDVAAPTRRDMMDLHEICVELNRQVRKIGVNVNQIARATHQRSVSMDEAIADLDEFGSQLQKAIDNGLYPR